MKKPKYRIKRYDEVLDVHILEKKVFLFWKRIGVGSEEKLKETIERLEKQDK